MLVLSLGPVLGTTAAAAVIASLWALVAFVTRSGSPADTLPACDDAEGRFDALAQKVRRRARIKGAVARWTGHADGR